MNLSFKTQLADGYNSPSQIVRVLSEAWVKSTVYCPNCGADNICRHRDNQPVLDFYCETCREDYELKSKRNTLGKKLVDGAYDAKMKSIASGEGPNFFALSYDAAQWRVNDFIVIPKHFFVPDVIEKRKPLSKKAKRAGWVGCNINIAMLPESGKVHLVRQGSVQPKLQVMAAWQKVLFLKSSRNSEARGWLLDIMKCIEWLRKDNFALSEIYAFEEHLKLQHPDNAHVKDKIRQQLQILRDRGYLKFLGNGHYSLA